MWADQGRTAPPASRREKRRTMLWVATHRGRDGRALLVEARAIGCLIGWCDSTCMRGGLFDYVCPITKSCCSTTPARPLARSHPSPAAPGRNSCRQAAQRAPPRSSPRFAVPFGVAILFRLWNIRSPPAWPGHAAHRKIRAHYRSASCRHRRAEPRASRVRATQPTSPNHRRSRSARETRRVPRLRTLVGWTISSCRMFPHCPRNATRC